MNLIPFQAVYPDLSLISSPESFFGTVKSQYPEYVKSGFFQKAAQEGIYIYKIVTRLGSYTGVIACTHISDFIKGRVLKHENTLAAKEQQMMNIVLQNRAMVKPILLAYEDNDNLSKLIQKVMKKDKPFFEVEFKETDESHTLWSVVDGNMIQAIKKIFKEDIKKTYIADGHHRSATAVSLYNTNHHVYDRESVKGVLCVYFPFEDLKIYDYNRVIEIFQDLDPIDFTVKLSKFCKITPMVKAKKPKRKHEMTLMLNKKWYKLKWKPSYIKQKANKALILDADLLNKYLLNEICGITNVREDRRIKYVDGVSGVVGLASEVNKNDYRIGICLYPISQEELRMVAEKGDTLPPKSTWFEPRVKNGMVVKEL